MIKYGTFHPKSENLLLDMLINVYTTLIKNNCKRFIYEKRAYMFTEVCIFDFALSMGFCKCKFNLLKGHHIFAVFRCVLLSLQGI